MTPSDMADIVKGFPSVRHAFAYGSAAFEQPGLYENTNMRPMLDFIFVVESPCWWHQQNLRRNTAHYSCGARLHSSLVTTVAKHVGVGVYFNPAVRAYGQMIKYGVVGMNTLLRDLRAWDNLFLAGRLHKPVLHIVKDAAVMDAIDANLRAALAASLLMLPHSFTTQELLEGICGISYMGDIRMGLAEDRHKVRRIVEGSWGPLQQLYKPIIEGTTGRLAHLALQGEGRWEQDMAPSSRDMLIGCLPQGVRMRMSGMHRLHAASDGGLASDAALRQAIRNIVRRSSFRQACLGVFSAGGFKGISYLIAKARKS